MSDTEHPKDDSSEDSAVPPSERGEAQHAAADEELRAERADRPERAKSRTKGRRAARVEPKRGSSPLVLAVLVALAAGAAGGWFGHVAQAKAQLKAESAPAASGSAAASGPCGAWQQKICAGSGDSSLACAQARNATDLLTPSTCEVALAAVPATLAKVKSGRVACDSLIAKLCADLPQGSPTCGMVRERTPSFPPDRCADMLSHYDQVIGELRQMEQSAAQMGGMPPGRPGSVPGVPGAHP